MPVTLFLVYIFSKQLLDPRSVSMTRGLVIHGLKSTVTVTSAPRQ